MRAIPTLKISISGVRGIIGDSLTPMLLMRFAKAFGACLTLPVMERSGYDETNEYR